MCGPTGDRTRDQRIKSPVLCQLSYRPQLPMVNDTTTVSLTHKFP